MKNKNGVESKLLFEIETPLHFVVRVTQEYWNLIVNIKHPVMQGQEEVVKLTLSHPDEVRQSKSDENVYLFYKKVKEKRWVCSVTKKLAEEGFLITCYPTDIIKEGVKIWPK